MSIVCRIIGHVLQRTMMFHEIADDIEVYDARYCRNCGDVIPARLNSR